MKIGFGLLLSLLISSCASICGKTTDHLEIHSEPEGAEVYFRERYLGKTPVTVELPRRPETNALVVKMPGYADKRVSVDRKMDGTAFWNLGFITTTSGVTSWGVDLLTGKMWEYYPGKYIIKMEKAAATAPIEAWNESALEYVIVNQGPLKKDLVRREGETLQVFCHILNKTDQACSEMAARTVSLRPSWEKLDGIELYRALQQSDIGYHISDI